MSDIRQRYSSRRSAPSDSMSGEETDPFTPGAGLSAKAMIDVAPQHHGSVKKLHVPVFYSILPSIIQRIILSWSCLKSFAPSWKERHMILCGSYLYKFKDTSSTIPKGSPFDIKTLTTDILRTSDRDKNISEFGNLPAGYSSIFTVSTLRRHHYYAVSDTEEAMLWVRSLHEARQEGITRNMGHASNVPYPSSWRHFDSLGKGLVKSKDRIKERMEKSGLEHMEMTAFPEGQIPRGYYG
jgi:hypothetical protein